jgi:DeoR/GlpR family transcriptional regulator of sugar metabolism
MGEYTATIQDALAGSASTLASAQRQLRTMSVKRAADEILELFKNSEMLYYSDIAERLNISSQTAIQACEMLEQQGKIQGAGDGSTRPQGSRNRNSPRPRRRT